MEEFEVRNAEVEAKLRELGYELHDKIPAGMGFALLLFDLDYSEKLRGQGNLFYISSARREEMIKAMEEFLEKQKGK